MKSSLVYCFFFFFVQVWCIVKKIKGQSVHKARAYAGSGKDLTIWCIVHNFTLFLGKRLFSRLELDNKFTFASKLPLLVYCYLCKKKIAWWKTYTITYWCWITKKTIFSQTSPNVKFRYLYSNNCYIYAMLHTIMLLYKQCLQYIYRQ
jgi:hypothetical protein